jgi:type I restriction enzyme R subunit
VQPPSLGPPPDAFTEYTSITNLSHYPLFHYRYSLDETRRALDLCLFINGLPIATFELKNSLTSR